MTNNRKNNRPDGQHGPKQTKVAGVVGKHTCKFLFTVKWDQFGFNVIGVTGFTGLTDFFPFSPVETGTFSKILGFNRSPPSTNMLFSHVLACVNLFTFSGSFTWMRLALCFRLFFKLLLLFLHLFFFDDPSVWT